MEIAVVGATAAVTLAGGTVEQARLAITALAPTIRLVPEAEEALVGSDAGAEAVQPQRRPRLGRPSPSPTSGLRPTTGARWRRCSGDNVLTAAVARARGEAIAIPASSALFRSGVVKIPVTLNVNGIAYELELAPSTTLLYAVRDAVGSHGLQGGLRRLGMRRLHDAARRQAREPRALSGRAGGRARGDTTVEGLADGGSLAPLQRVPGYGGVQCGFCTPGMLISATALLEASPNPSEDEVGIALSGNLCRCTMRRDREGCAGDSRAGS